MYYNNAYPGYNYNNGAINAWGGIFAFILVIFILLVIIGCNNRCNNSCFNNPYCN